ncbi:hypothetical protein PQ455_18590 [Sphingomonas naphthae]|uniref:Uncharacterized protein n=1 Tax=Sphingomonas naphthae TaxID=1813468 RepID=A0ABY7TMY8_9SPHN|nr:hypothetical protein [Sphingomonas naphthae]WCT73589.1 hypothetical protein PQ455_18590 [Sphingomonas naphthae]
MILFALTLQAAEPVAPAPVEAAAPVAPSEMRIATEAKAKECGLKPAQMVWKPTEDHTGERLFLWQIGKNATKPAAATCLLGWAQESRANIEWVALEPAE